MTDAPAVEKAPQEPVAADAPLAPAAPTEPKPTTEAPAAEKPAEAVPATADQEVPELGTNGTPSTQPDTAKPVTEASEAHGPVPGTPPTPLEEVEAPQAAGSEPAANGEVKDIQTKDPAAEETHRMELDTGDKRKVDDTTDVNGLKGATNGAASGKGPEAAERAGKKQKTNGASEPAPATTARKPRGGKKKKPLAPVGRTARKTRSQGPVEV